jgi:DNA-binding NarL/FixJ family response regulator
MGCDMSIKIILADDHRLFRDMLSSLLDEQTGMEVVARANNGRETVKLVREKRPDVVIMDITMPDLNGIDATSQIISESPEVKVIGLSMHTDKRFIIRMFRAGAKGYLDKDCAFKELTAAIFTVIKGKIYLSQKIFDTLFPDVFLGNSLDAEDTKSNPLTKREREILQLIAEGWQTKEIAFHLNVSSKTVDTHRHNIMDKLNVKSIAELTKFAIREGLTSLED